MFESLGKSDLEKFERHWFTCFHDALRWNRDPPPHLARPSHPLSYLFANVRNT